MAWFGSKHNDIWPWKQWKILKFIYIRNSVTRQIWCTIWSTIKDSNKIAQKSDRCDFRSLWKLIDMFIYRDSTTDQECRKLCLYVCIFISLKKNSFIENTVTFHRKITLIRDKLHWKDDFHANKQTNGDDKYSKLRIPVIKGVSNSYKLYHIPKSSICNPKKKYQVLLIYFIRLKKSNKKNNEK